MGISEDMLLRPVKKKFVEWRRTRRGRESIPDALWDEVYGLEQVVGRTRLKRELGLNSSQIATNPKAEPNSDYRRALGYFVGNQAGLTAFLREPGVPLTTTEAERGAKFTKRHHHNSLSFQTARGANVGAFFMSLIATCLGLGVNPLQYLAAIIHWRGRITDDNASDWMPDTFERGVDAALTAQQVNTLGYRVCHRRIRDPMAHESPPQSALFSPAKSQASHAVH